MTSPGLLEILNPGAESATTPSLPAAASEVAGTGQDEALLALFIGVNHQAYLFTSRRLLILRRVKPLVRQLSGRRLIDLTEDSAGLSLPEVFRQTRIKKEIPVEEITWMDAERVYSAGAVIVFARGRRYELTIGHKCAEIAPYVNALRAALGIPLAASGQAMKRDLRMWSLFCCLTGSLTFLLSFVHQGVLEPVWGLALTVIGAGVWFSVEPAMFIILGVGMAWAATMNLLGLNPSLLNKGHLPLGVPLQIYWAVMLFAKYRKYEHLYDPGNTVSASTQIPGRASSLPGLTESPVMPILSSAIGATGLILLGLHFTTIREWPLTAAAMITRGHLYLAVIGLAVGLASCYSRRGQRRAALAGITVNAVTALTLITLLMTKWHHA
ncbi:MAG TPA: hypothetical protein VFD58_18900 [Blastocatellia bacterium]|nr:hypothetical protein [Blastocatellia bacterium]